MTDYKYQCPRCLMKFEEGKPHAKSKGLCAEEGCRLPFSGGHMNGEKTRSAPCKTTAAYAKSAGLMVLQP